MAGSRGEKFGSIFSRWECRVLSRAQGYYLDILARVCGDNHKDKVTGLLGTGALKPADKPIWYEVYAAFPPKVEPKFERDVDEREPMNILYREDFVRARFYKTYGCPQPIDLRKTTAEPSISQRFLSKFAELESKSNTLAEDELFSQAVDALKSEDVLLRPLEDIQKEREERQREYMRQMESSPIDVTELFLPDVTESADNNQAQDLAKSPTP